MSIIDKTLQRLDASSDAGHAMAAAEVAAAAYLRHDLGYLVAARRRRLPMTLWLALGFLAIGVLAYVGLPTQLSAPSVPAPAEPLAAGAAAATPTPAPMVAPTPAPDQKPVPALAAVTPLPAAPLAAQPVAAAQASPPMAAPQDQPAASALPGWIVAGRRAWLAGEYRMALQTWEAGLHGLPDGAQVWVGNAYTDYRGLHGAYALGDPGWPLFGFRETNVPPDPQRHFYRIAMMVPKEADDSLRQLMAQRYGRAEQVGAAYLRWRRFEGAAAPAPTSDAAARVDRTTTTPVVIPKRAVAPAVPAVAVVAPRRVEPEPPARASESVTVAASGLAAAWDGRAATIREQLQARDFTAAARAAEVLARDFPERWEPWYWLGTALLASGRLGEAEAALDRGIATNGQSPQVWIQRAVAAQERRDHGAAISYLQEAEKLSSRLPEIHLNLGYSHDALGQTSEADRRFARFLSLTDGVVAYAVQRKHVQLRLSR